MHGECARRAGYYMECGNNDIDNQEAKDDKEQSSGAAKKTPSVMFRDRTTFKIFCEGHRPFKLIKQIKEKHESNTEDLVKFCKSMKKAVDVMSRIPYRCRSVAEKKWKEKDKKTLLDRVRDRFFMYRKLRINVLRVDPSIKRKRRSHGSSIPKIRSKRQKLNEYSETNGGNDQVSMSSVIESSVRSSKAYSKTGEPREVYYKLANP